MNLKVELLFHNLRQILEQIDPVESNCTSTYSTYEALFQFLDVCLISSWHRLARTGSWLL